jgi:hypothetical protein
MELQCSHLRASTCKSWKVWLALNVKSRKIPLRKPWDQCIKVKHYIYMSRVHDTYKTSSQPVQTQCVFLDNHAHFLLTLIFETVSSMYSLFLALVLFPQVQRRAQAELDVVIGRDRLPTFDDRPRLPYIEALCKELLRWQMVTPMGTPVP